MLKKKEPKPHAKFSPSWLLALALLLTACEPKTSAELENLTSQLHDVKGKTRVAQDRMRVLNDQFYTLSRELGSENPRQSNELKSQLAEIHAYVVKLEEVTAHLKQSISLWKEPCRKSLSGMALGSFPLSDGRSIVSARVKEINDDGVLVEHEGGVEQLDYKVLPESVRTRVVHEETILALELMK